MHMMPKNCGICWSVCHAGSCAKTAQRINSLCGVETPEDPRNTALDGGPYLPEEEGVQHDLCQITLATCLNNQLMQRLESRIKY